MRQRTELHHQRCPPKGVRWPAPCQVVENPAIVHRPPASRSSGDHRHEFVPILTSFRRRKRAHRSLMRETGKRRRRRPRPCLPASARTRRKAAWASRLAARYSAASVRASRGWLWRSGRTGSGGTGGSSIRMSAARPDSCWRRWPARRSGRPRSRGEPGPGAARREHRGPGPRGTGSRSWTGPRRPRPPRARRRGRGSAAVRRATRGSRGGRAGPSRR